MTATTSRKNMRNLPRENGVSGFETDRRPSVTNPPADFSRFARAKLHKPCQFSGRRFNPFHRPLPLTHKKK